MKDSKKEKRKIIENKERKEGGEKKEIEGKWKECKVPPRKGIGFWKTLVASIFSFLTLTCDAH